MAGKALYQDDIHAWALDQAEALRNLVLKADPGVGGLDLPPPHRGNRGDLPFRTSRAAKPSGDGASALPGRRRKS